MDYKGVRLTALRSVLTDAFASDAWHAQQVLKGHASLLLRSEGIVDAYLATTLASDVTTTDPALLPNAAQVILSRGAVVPTPSSFAARDRWQLLLHLTTTDELQVRALGPEGYELPVTELCITGAGLDVSLRRTDAEERPDLNRFSAWLKSQVAVAEDSENSPLSRTRGVLGDHAMNELRKWRFAVVGAGRLGSQIAEGVARLRPAGLTLIDGDSLERSNLDGVGFEEQLGSNKAELLGAKLSEFTPTIAIAKPVQVRDAFMALADAHIIISACDDDGARALCAIAARAFMKIHLDVATGIIAETETEERGADIRITMPGDACLRCLGGFARPEQIYAITQLDYKRNANWRAGHRQGSLYSLNSIASGIGLRLIEELARNTLNESQWWHVTESFPDRMVASLERNRSLRLRPCRVCEAWPMGGDVLTGVPAELKSATSIY